VRHQSLKSPWAGQKVPIVAKIQDHEITWVEFYKQYESSKRKAETSEKRSSTLPNGTRQSSTHASPDDRYGIFRHQGSGKGIVIPNEKVEEQVQQYRDMLVPESSTDEERSILQRIATRFRA